MESDLYRKIGHQIKRTRENLGLSQIELAKKIGYQSPGTISHFESGLRKINLMDLQKIANTLGVSIDFLLGSESPNNLMQQFQLRASNVRPSAREDVVEFLVFVHSNSNKPKKLAFDAKDLEPEIAADKLLDFVKVDAPPISPLDMTKELGIPVFDWDFPDEVSGIFVIENKQVSIGINRNHPNVRQRFTIAHELGHYVYQEDNELFLDFNEYDIPIHVYDEENQKLETKANRFAANLLMPKGWVKKDFAKYGEVGLSQIARKYIVSEQAMWFRLLNLNLVKNVL